MTKLALITAKQYKEGINEVGDIIASFSDDHKFTPTELEEFNIITIDDSKEIVENIVPSSKNINRSKTLDWTEEEPERKNVWQDKDESWKEVVKDPKYKTRYEDGLVKENYSRYSENLTTVIAGSK